MSAPYYERDGVAIYLGDCRDVLPILGKESVDLMVTDPPYGVGWLSGHRSQGFGKIAGDDDASWVPAALDLAANVIRPRRHVYVFGPDALLGERYVARAQMVWDKGKVGMGDLTEPWGPSHESITFAVRAQSKGDAARGDGRLSARMRRGSVLRFPRPSGPVVNRHPTVKPVPLLRCLIESSTLVGEIVLDPFLGSGSTLVAAIAEGRKGIGIELEERYAEVAAERVDKALNAARELEAVFA